MANPRTSQAVEVAMVPGPTQPQTATATHFLWVFRCSDFENFLLPGLALAALPQLCSFSSPIMSHSCHPRLQFQQRVNMDFLCYLVFSFWDLVFTLTTLLCGPLWANKSRGPLNVYLTFLLHPICVCW